jgi:hypothetical protein
MVLSRVPKVAKGGTRDLDKVAGGYGQIYSRNIQAYDKILWNTVGSEIRSFVDIFEGEMPSCTFVGRRGGGLVYIGQG